MGWGDANKFGRRVTRLHHRCDITMTSYWKATTTYHMLILKSAIRIWKFWSSKFDFLCPLTPRPCVWYFLLSLLKRYRRAKDSLREWTMTSGHGSLFLIFLSFFLFLLPFPSSFFPSFFFSPSSFLSSSLLHLSFIFPSSSLFFSLVVADWHRWLLPFPLLQWIKRICCGTAGSVSSFKRLEETPDPVGGIR